MNPIKTVVSAIRFLASLRRPDLLRQLSHSRYSRHRRRSPRSTRNDPRIDSILDRHGG